MSYKDTLTIYEELVATGVPESQAKIQAHQMGAAGNAFEAAVGGLDRAIQGMNKRLDKIDSVLFWMRIIAIAMTVAFLSNGIIETWFR